MPNIRRHLLLLPPVIALLSACAPMSPEFDARFGEAVQRSTKRQILDPDAANANAGIDHPGIDGKAGKAVMDRYHKSMVHPQPQPDAMSIGVGGSVTSSTR